MFKGETIFFFTWLLQYNYCSYSMTYWTIIIRKEDEIDQPITQAIDTEYPLWMDFSPRYHGRPKRNITLIQKAKYYFQDKHKFKKDCNWFLFFFFPQVPPLYSQLPLTSNGCHLGKRARGYVDTHYWTKRLSDLDDLIWNYSEDQLYTIPSGHKTDQIIFLYKWFILVSLISFLFLDYFLCINDIKNMLS